MDSVAAKQKFFEDNVNFSENKDTRAANWHISESEESQCEFWLLQCPKGTNLSLLEGEKLKLPGRTRGLNELEAVAVELDTPQNHAFGYSNRKGRSSLRMLPIQGSIVVRSTCQRVKPVTAEETLALCPPTPRVAVPKIKQRHPIFGAAFEQKVQVSETTAQRLKAANENSLRLVRQSLKRSAFGSRDTGVESKKNRTHSETAATPTKKSKKTPKSPKKEKIDDYDDLQWLHQI